MTSGGKLSGCSGCLQSDGVYSARRLRHRDNPPPPAKAKPRGSAAPKWVHAFRSTQTVVGVTSATARIEHLM